MVNLTNINGNIIQIDGNKSIHFKSDANTNLSILSDGKVGIGIDNPFDKLQINGNIRIGSSTDDNTSEDITSRINTATQLVIHANKSGYNINSNNLYLRAGGSNYAEIKLGGGTANTDKTITFRNSGSIERMRIHHNGNVGIGTIDPYFPLHVVGESGATASGSRRFFYHSGTGFGTDGEGSGPASIYANRDIMSGRFFISTQGQVVSSDERIKKDISDINDGDALNILRLLKPKKYSYKDTISRGSEPVWGFIAQEVRDTLPYATFKRNDFIPNIYELANVSSSNVITFTNFNTSDLESHTNVLIRIIDINDKEHDIHLTEIIDKHSIRVEEDLDEWIGSVDESGNVIQGTQIFVYGEEVHDFHVLKKDAIFTVATAALQEVDRQQQADKARISELETQLASVLTRLNALENS